MAAPEPLPDDDARIARMVEAVENGLRLLGFTERTIRDHRRATRAAIAAHLKGSADRG